MNRRLVSALLLLLLGVSALAGCGPSAAETAALPALHWDGSALTGVRFAKRHMSMLTVYYAEPTMPSATERLAVMVNEFLEKNQVWGRFLPGQRMAIWVIPQGYAWPQEVPPLDRRERPARAVQPRVVMVDESAIPTDIRDIYSLANSGILHAAATAVTQPENSLAYRIAWLHDGLGGFYMQDWFQFPAGLYLREFTGKFYDGSPRTYRPPTEILRVLDDRTKLLQIQLTPRDAATGLAALVIDRWGVDFLERYPRTPEELTPEAALLWATDTTDTKQAVKAAAERMVEATMPFYNRKQFGDLNYRVGVSLVDTGKNRLTPKVVQLPAGPDPTVPRDGLTPSPNLSPHSYRIAVDWDPATLTVSGEEQLTWTNGEGVPVSHLYFNVLGNSTPVLKYGGSTKVAAVSVDGKPVDYVFQGMDLEVPLGREVPPGRTARVTIRFATRLPGPIPLPTHIKSWDPFKRKPGDPELLWPMTLWYPVLAVFDEEGWHLTSFPKAGTVVAESADYEVRVSTPPGSRVDWKYRATDVFAEGDRTVFQSRFQNELEWTGRIMVQK